jgi:hypothetical protein
MYPTGRLISTERVVSLLNAIEVSLELVRKGRPNMKTKLTKLITTGTTVLALAGMLALPAAADNALIHGVEATGRAIGKGTEVAAKDTAKATRTCVRDTAKAVAISAKKVGHGVKHVV